MKISSFDDDLYTTNIKITKLRKHDDEFGPFFVKEVSKIYRFDNNYGVLIKSGVTYDANEEPKDITEWELETIKFLNSDPNTPGYEEYPISEIWNYTFKTYPTERLTEYKVCNIMKKVKKYKEDIDDYDIEYTPYERKFLKKADNIELEEYYEGIYDIIVNESVKEKFWFMDHETIEELIRFYEYYKLKILDYDGIIHITDPKIKGAFYKTVFKIRYRKEMC